MTEQGTSSRACHPPSMAGRVGSGQSWVGMTQNRRPKRAIRSRMAQTGEKYTEARRAHLASGGHSGGASAGEYPGGTITWPEDSLGWFTDQAYNAILLAADEARMLSHPGIGPEH